LSERFFRRRGIIVSPRRDSGALGQNTETPSREGDKETAARRGEMSIVLLLCFANRLWRFHDECSARRIHVIKQRATYETGNRVCEQHPTNNFVVCCKQAILLRHFIMSL